MAWFAWALVASLTAALPGADDATEVSVRVDGAVPVEAGTDLPATQPQASAGVAGASVAVGGATESSTTGPPAPEPVAATTTATTTAAAGPAPTMPLGEDAAAPWGLAVLLSGALASAGLAARAGVTGRVARWLLALPVLGLFSRIRRDRLEDHPVRRDVMAALDARPGACVEDVVAVVDRAYGTVRYHLERLERERLVVAHVDGRRRRYWRMEAAEARHRPAASLLLADTPQRIAAVVRDHPGLNQREVASRLRIQPPVACKYLKRLEAEGLVQGHRDGRVKRYHPGRALSALASGPEPVAA